MPAHRYWAFLSYSSHDLATAQWLHRALENYVVAHRLVGTPTPGGPAPRRFRPIFHDRTELPADSDLGATLESALTQSAYLIVICSPSAAKSQWVDKEIELFRALHGTARIFSVIASDCPVGSHLDCFPSALRYRADSSTAQRPEPIAVDLRPGKDGRRMARLKLIAGMLGVGLDDVVRRDDRRRYRRMVAITAASLAGMAITGALATAALIARNEAQKQRGHAEGLIEFMLTDLRKKLEPGGHLDSMDGVGTETLKYYSAQNPHDLDAQSLARRARALRLMGEIRIQRGDLGQALASFEQASGTTGELLLRSPNDAQGIFNHAQNIFWVGEIARQRGDTARAESSFQEYRRLAEHLTAIDPGNDDWRAELGYAESDLGVLFLHAGRTDDAIGAFQHTLAEAETLAQRHPDDLNRQVEWAQGNAWLADAVQQRGRLAQVRNLREKELAIYRTILTKDPTFRQAKYSAVIGLQILGRLALIEGDLNRALANFSDAADRAEDLLTGERENMDLTSVVAIAQVDLGEALLAMKEVRDARIAQKRADTLLAAVLAHDATVTRWRNYRDRADLLQAAIAEVSGDSTQAMQLDQAVITRLETAPAPAANTEPFWILQRARLQFGDDLIASGRAPEAQVEWQGIVGSLPKGIAAYEPRLLRVLETANNRLDHRENAQAISQYLASLSAPAAHP